MFHTLDNLLDGFTYDNLITAILSNESEINEQVVKKVFNELLQTQLVDSNYLLKTNMQKILKICKENREV